MEHTFPSQAEQAKFKSWLKSVLKDSDGDINAWINFLIMRHDWSASRVVEISGRQTKSGNPEIYIFESATV